MAEEPPRPRRWWWWGWSKPAAGGSSSQEEQQRGSASLPAPPASTATEAAVGGDARPPRRSSGGGEGPSMVLLGASALGILGCGVAAGMYRAQKGEGKALLNKLTKKAQQEKQKQPRLTAEQQVKHWRRPTATVQGPFGIPIPPGFNPTRFAAKALAIGTVLCLSATGAVAFVVGRAMGVRDVYEFADAVRAWAPRKRRELEGWLGVKPNQALEAERAAVAKMSYEEEMAHWEQVMLAEGERDRRDQQEKEGDKGKGKG